ncbi:hypothetical protein L484_002991 [Morus notabilis]|uniref:Uncharacterized protein n=1 Tax=Morus notabilis TaxID=981085 RepID=W9SPN7_9ROSA|nr:hypothetical protein L484_002991 [Morus notabilis]
MTLSKDGSGNLPNSIFAPGPCRAFLESTNYYYSHAIFLVFFENQWTTSLSYASAILVGIRASIIYQFLFRDALAPTRSGVPRQAAFAAATAAEVELLCKQIDSVSRKLAALRPIGPPPTVAEDVTEEIPFEPPPTFDKNDFVNDVFVPFVADEGPFLDIEDERSKMLNLVQSLTTLTEKMKIKQLIYDILFDKTDVEDMQIKKYIFHPHLAIRKPVKRIHGPKIGSLRTYEEDCSLLISIEATSDSRRNLFFNIFNVKVLVSAVVNNDSNFEVKSFPTRRD